MLLYYDDRHETITSAGETFDFRFLTSWAEIDTNLELWMNAGLMLIHRLQRWPTIDPTAGERLLGCQYLSSERS